MKVTLVAATQIDDVILEDLGYHAVDGVTGADELAEFAGRTCYLSYNRPNPATASNANYLHNIIASQHFSVLEHASVTFHISDVSRTFTHELVRHRHFSFSQVSQRYVDESDCDVVLPPILDDVSVSGDVREDLTIELAMVREQAKLSYSYIFSQLRELGFPLKQAREAARSVLPNATSTEIVVTGNHRAWREFLNKRLSAAADKEIRLVATEILRQLKLMAPNTYQDFELPS